MCNQGASFQVPILLSLRSQMVVEDFQKSRITYNLVILRGLFSKTTPFYLINELFLVNKCNVFLNA